MLSYSYIVNRIPSGGRGEREGIRCCLPGQPPACRADTCACRQQGTKRSHRTPRHMSAAVSFARAAGAPT